MVFDAMIGWVVVRVVVVVVVVGVHVVLVVAVVGIHDQRVELLH